MMATLRDFILDFDHVHLLYDSMSDISVAKNPMLHSKTKHMMFSFTFVMIIMRKATYICATLMPQAAC
jgi:hypothetical protein